MDTATLAFFVVVAIVFGAGAAALRWTSPNHSDAIQRPQGRQLASIFACVRLTGKNSDEQPKGFSPGSGAVALSILAFGVGILGHALFVVRAGSTVEAGFMALLVAIPTIALGAAARKSAIDHKKSLQAQLDRHTGPFVLYFRPFSFDLTTIAANDTVRTGVYASRKIRISIEEVLGNLCLRAGVGFRSIGRVDGQLGPTASVTSDDNWQAEALSLMKKASVLVLVPANSLGSTWEIEQVISGPMLERTVWVMPPASIMNDGTLSRSWEAIGGLLRQRYSLPFPALKPEGALFAFAVDAVGSKQLELAPYSMEYMGRLIRDVPKVAVNGEQSLPASS